MGGLFGGGMSTSEPRLGAIQIQQSTAGTPVALVYGKTRVPVNLIDYVDFKSTPHTQTAGGKGGGVSNTTYTYSASVAIGVCQGGALNEIQIGAVWCDKNKFTTLAAITGSPTSPISSAIGSQVTSEPYTTQAALLTAAGGWAIFDGSPAQTAWGYLSTYFADHALNYRGLAYLASVAHALKSNAVLGNYTVEVRGLKRFSATVDDANPKDVLVDFMTNAIYGAGLPAAEFGDLSAFSNWCVANSLFISPAFIAQKSAADHWTEILNALQCAAVYSDGLLKIIPFGDAAVTGNGATFTPDLTPLYFLSDDDFLDHEQPITVRRKTQADAFNEVACEYTNRANDYNIGTVTLKDQASVERYGLRPASVAKWDFIAAPTVAVKCVQMALQRGIYVRNEYEFKLGWNYALLEPMDIIALTDADLGLVNFPVRILSTDESADGEISIIAEELIYGLTAPLMLGIGQMPSGNLPNASSAPGAVEPPLMIEPPLALTGGANQLWIALAGGANWGGAHVWMSLDGNSYTRVGIVTDRSIYGTLHAATGAPSANPDITNTITVDLNSVRQMYSVSQADVDANVSLCWLGGELFSYRDATLAAAQRYDLAYHHRGLYGTTGIAHSAGASFARLDDALYKYALGSLPVDTTVYFKFTSFNLWSQAEENLADVVEYTHVVAGGLAAAPADLRLSADFVGTSFTVQWNAVAGATNYDVDILAGSILRHTYTPTATTQTYTLSDAITDGFLERDFEVRVAAVASGVQSAYAQIAFDNPLPAAVSGITATATANSITPSWTAITDTDLQDYQVFISTVSGFAPGAGNLVYTGTANTCVLSGLLPLTNYYLRIQARDKWGGTTWNLSAEFNKITLA